jgi:ComEC/Rec2-related protein
MTGIWIGAAVIAGAYLGTPAIVLVLLAGAAAWFYRHCSTIEWAAVLLAATLGVLRVGVVDHPANGELPAGIEAIRGRTVDAARQEADDQSLTVIASEARIGEQWTETDIRLYVLAPVAEDVWRGDQIYLAGTFRSITELEPGLREYFASIGVSATGFATWVEVEEAGTGPRRWIEQQSAAIRDRIAVAAPGDQGALLAGLVTGDDARLSDQRVERFVATGTTHITAVSGSNFALLIIMMASLGGSLGWRRRLLWITLAIFAIWIYAVLVGLPPSAVRAASVATLATIAPRVGRRPDFVTLIVVAAAAELLMRPGDVDRLAFRLSVASSLAMALVLQRREREGLRGILGPAVLATLTAQLATLPILITAFGELSIVSLPANVLISPVVSVTFLLAAVATVALPLVPLLGRAIIDLAGLGAAFIIGVVDALGGRSWSQVTVGRIGPWGVAVVLASSVIAISGLSPDCRTAFGRWQGQARRRPDLTVAGVGGVLLGAVAGLLLALVFR